MLTLSQGELSFKTVTEKGQYTPNNWLPDSGMLCAVSLSHSVSSEQQNLKQTMKVDMYFSYVKST